MSKEVRFVLTSTDKIPAELKNTGSLIVMSDPDGTIPASELGKVFDKYIYYEDELIAGGIGFNSIDELINAAYAGLSYNDIYSKLLSLHERDDVYLMMAYDYTDAHGGGTGGSYWGGIVGNIINQADLWSYLTSLQNQISSNVSDISDLTSKVTSNTNNITTLGDNITEINSYLDDIFEEIDGLDELKDNVSYLLTSYEYVTNELSFIEDEIDAITGDVNNIQDGLDELSTYSQTYIGYLEGIIMNMDKYYPLTDEDVDEAINKVNA